MSEVDDASPQSESDDHVMQAFACHVALKPNVAPYFGATEIWQCCVSLQQHCHTQHLIRYVPLSDHIQKLCQEILATHNRVFNLEMEHCKSTLKQRLRQLCLSATRHGSMTCKQLT